MFKIIHYIIKLILTLSVLLVINSCAYFKLKTLDSYEYNNNDVYSLLSKEYKEFAKSELYEMHDELDANYFAYKALIVKNENRIYLENPDDWNIPSHILDETITYYKKINQTIKENIEKYPTQVALMISGYDCWLEQLEESWQIEDIKKCKLKFLNNYNEIIKLVANTSKPVSEEKVTSSKAKKEKTNKEKFKITVFFNYDKFSLTNNELINLNKVITAANKFKDQSITIIGHTDTKGSDNYNLILSKKRANFIKKHLQSKNIINNIITIGLGEKSPLIDTGDNKLEEKNRRAQIIFN